MESYTDVLREPERGGCGLETVSFTAIVKEDGITRRGMCSVSLEAKGRIKLENSAIFHNSRFKFTCGAQQSSLQKMSFFYDQTLVT